MKNVGDIIIRARVTEKSAMQSEGEGPRVYTFEIRKDANKHDVVGAIKTLYKVVPEEVRVINIPRRKVTVRGKSGMTGGYKKAMVSLKKGDKIEFA